MFDEQVQQARQQFSALLLLDVLVAVLVEEPAELLHGLVVVLRFDEVMNEIFDRFRLHQNEPTVDAGGGLGHAAGFDEGDVGIPDQVVLG